MHFRFLILSLSGFCSLPCIAQHEQTLGDNEMSLQYGYGLKCVIEWPFNDVDPKPIFKFSLTGGAASNFLIEEIHPSIHLELLFYNGGLGSKRPYSSAGRKVVLDIITGVTVSAGLRNLMTQQDRDDFIGRRIPLYYFSNFNYPCLENPFNYSLSLGTNMIWSTDAYKTFQRVGFLNIHIDRFQTSYYNDGGFPMSHTNLGDRRDRYYTGGVVLSFHAGPSEPVNLFELAYHKFTGYSRNAFEGSNELDLAFVNYKKKEQSGYNKSLWTFSFGSPADGWGINISNYNRLDWDIQHLIHRALFNAFHISPNKTFWSISGQYYKSFNKINLR
jgi:hypothetical protein